MMFAEWIYYKNELELEDLGEYFNGTEHLVHDELDMVFG
jgi:hypothetical protein